METGKEFFSKDDLLNYIKAGSHHSGKPQSTNRHITRHAERTPAPVSHVVLFGLLLFLIFFICLFNTFFCWQLVNDNGELPKWLPKGWKVEVKTRKSGLLIGKEYKVSNIFLTFFGYIPSWFLAFYVYHFHWTLQSCHFYVLALIADFKSTFGPSEYVSLTKTFKFQENTIIILQRFF